MAWVAYDVAAAVWPADLATWLADGVVAVCTAGCTADCDAGCAAVECRQER